VSDSVAVTLGTDPASRTAWLSSPPEWQARLIPPFLDRVRTRLKVAAQPDSATAAVIARALAARAAFVRWPPDGGADLTLQNDPDVRLALASFPRLKELLAPPPGTR
jgi:hypothetical protein